MSLNKIYLLILSGCLAVFTSCADKPDPTLSKNDENYKNPYEPGTYDHFKAEKSYPKTYDTWTNVQLLPQTNSSNSWLQIDLASQRGMLMNGDEVVLDYAICSGTRSHPTPKGEYKILEKVVDKSSNKYGKIYDVEGKVVNSDADITVHEVPEGGKFTGAPMRYWMRLTSDGVGHHIGPVRRYPASHGCIRGPSGMMPKIYSKLAVGSKVVVK